MPLTHERGDVDLAALFEPFRLKSLQLENRIVMAPMTRSKSPGGVPGADVGAYYRRRAEAAVGLILSEATVVDRPASANDPDVPHFHGERALAGWRGVIEGVHAAGGKMGPQLWHVGSLRNPAVRWRPPAPSESPSGFSSPGKRFGEPMSDEAIADVIVAFARGAAEAKALGFDCLEVHGAHGYLIDQFFWDQLNERQDLFGGSTLAERATFAAEIVRASRAEVGEDFPLFFRISQFKQQNYSARIVETPQELERWLAPLVDAGVDMFHCSQRRFWQPEFEGSDLNLAGWTKKVTSLPTITVGSVGLTTEFMPGVRTAVANGAPASLDSLVARLERGEFDLVAVGRALLNDPEWALKVRDGRSAELKDYSTDALDVLH